jgi:hypothetical protein
MTTGARFAISAGGACVLAAATWLVASRYSRKAAPARLAVTVTFALGAGLVLTEIEYRSLRHWWEAHPIAAGTSTSIVILGATILLVDDVVKRYELARWRPVAISASRDLASSAGMLRITVNNFLRGTEATERVLALARNTYATESKGTEDRDVGPYDRTLARELPAVIETLVSDLEWVAALDKALKRSEKRARQTLATWAGLGVVHSDVVMAANKFADLVRRTEQLRWTCWVVLTANDRGWADVRVRRYRIATTAMPHLLGGFNADTTAASDAAEQALVSFGVDRLEDDNLERELGIA